METCNNCKAFEKLSGECRLEPPKSHPMVVVGQLQNLTLFPQWKASELMEKLIDLDFFPTLFKSNDPSGVLVNVLKNFQDNNSVTARSRVITLV